MDFGNLFAAYWWLIFPIFGMVMALTSAQQSERRARQALDTIKIYVEQGKEPPPELLRLASKTDDDDDTPGSASSSRAWSFIVFAGLAAGFGTGYYFARAEDYAFAFATIAVAMTVFALGALVLLITQKR